MGKKQKQQKQLIRELEAALAQTLSDWAIERQVNRSLAEERDAAEKDVAELLRDEEASTSCIRDLRRFVAQLQEERDAALEDVETLTQANAEADATIGELRALVEQQRNDWSGDVEASLEIIARKTDENIKLRRDSADTISDLRGDLADTHERLDAALTEAARMRKEWAGDVKVAREVIERKSNEIVDLRRHAADLRDELEALRANCGAQVANLEREMQTRQEHDAKTIGELRYEIAKLQVEPAKLEREAAKWRELAIRYGALENERDAEIQRLKNKWQHAEDLLQERERELDALRDQQAQQEHAEPVVTLQAIEELEEGERLIDDNGVIIESIPGGYEVRGAILTTHVGALQYYHEITGK